MGSRKIICADALKWLESDCPPCSIVTSPAEQAEIGGTIPEWRDWYLAACSLMFRALAPGAACVIYSTDRKFEGEWISKPAMMNVAAREAGVRQLWHKIALRKPVGSTDIHRPAYTHLIAFGGPEARPGAASPDVFERGKTVYPNGMGLIAARFAVQFAMRPGLPLVDPFCGRGTVPAVAEALGAEAIGVDILESQCDLARALKLQLRA